MANTTYSDFEYLGRCTKCNSSISVTSKDITEIENSYTEFQNTHTHEETDTPKDL